MAVCNSGIIVIDPVCTRLQVAGTENMLKLHNLHPVVARPLNQNIEVFGLELWQLGAVSLAWSEVYRRFADC